MLFVLLFYKSKSFFSKSSNDFEELKSLLQSTLETYEFLQRNSDKKIYLLFEQKLQINKTSFNVVIETRTILIPQLSSCIIIIVI